MLSTIFFSELIYLFKEVKTETSESVYVVLLQCSIILHYVSILSLLPACLTISAKVREGGTVSTRSDIPGSFNFIVTNSTPSSPYLRLYELALPNVTS